MSKQNKKIKIICVAAARPNFMKVAPLLDEFKKHQEFKPILVHTGQHYDYNMSGSFFKELNIQKPNYNLGVKAGLHGEQTGKTMIEFEKVCLKEKPDLVIVVGDVNATVACALVATKLHIKVAHVEAGLRSFNKKIPEEINRILTDHVADYLFTTEEEVNKNLLKEGIDKEKIFFVGDIMVDSLLAAKKRIKELDILNEFGLKKKKYALLTLHRPSNVDDKETLKNLLETFNIIQKKIPIIFPIHPRTKKRIEAIKLNKILKDSKNLLLTSPLSYLKNICLMVNSKFVLTDSGGIQQETTSLGIPCLTLRKNTERPITIAQGTNVLCGNNQTKILQEVKKILNEKKRKTKIPKYWDGGTARRVVKILDNII
jgi:UDP-N-acetylglucosamine 2-epimerase (non-hydrolysing)